MMGRETLLSYTCLKVTSDDACESSCNRLRITTLLFIASVLGSSSIAAIKNMAVVVSAGEQTLGHPTGRPGKLAKASRKQWRTERVSLCHQNPESPEMRVAVQNFSVMPRRLQGSDRKTKRVTRGCQDPGSERNCCAPWNPRLGSGNSRRYSSTVGEGLRVDGSCL